MLLERSIPMLGYVITFFNPLMQ